MTNTAISKFFRMLTIAGYFWFGVSVLWLAVWIYGAFRGYN